MVNNSVLDKTIDAFVATLSLTPLFGAPLAIADISMAMDLAFKSFKSNKRQQSPPSVDAIIKKIKISITESTEFNDINWDIIESIIENFSPDKFSTDELSYILSQQNSINIVEALTAVTYETFNLDAYGDKEKMGLRMLIQNIYKYLWESGELRSQLDSKLIIEILKSLKQQESAVEEHLTHIMGLLKSLLAQQEKLPLDRKLSGQNAKRLKDKKSFLDMTYERRGSKFIGRKIEKEILNKFLDDDGKLLWWQISGKAGQGKSRLALDLVDGLDEAWHAGFISANDLKNVDWNSIHFKRPTLIVIDYIANPGKVEKFGEIIRVLHKRILEPNENCEINQKLRFLVLERNGYDMSEDNLNQLNWLKHILYNSGVGNAIEDTKYEDKALELADLDTQDMKEIIKSWRENQNKPSFKAKDINKIIAQLEGARKNRAWRPLFAILFAELANENVEEKNKYIETILQHYLEKEKKEHWDIEDEPIEKAIYLACLATMVGGVPLKNIMQEPLYIKAGDSNSEIIRQALVLLGLTTKVKRRDDTIVLPPREPDLLGEFLIIYYLDPDRIGYDKSNVEKLVTDAWRYSPHLKSGDISSGFIDFIIRLREDFTDHPTTKALSEVSPPDNVKQVLMQYGTSLLYTIGQNPIIKECIESSNNEENLGTNLIMAAEIGNKEIAEYILKTYRHSDVNFIHRGTGIFPLLQAVQNGNIKIVSLLLENEADVNQLHRDGVFPILIAAQQGHTEVVSMLIEKGADINQANSADGIFPLLMAAHQGHAEVVSILIQEGGDINQINSKDGASPLLIAIQQGHAEVVSILVEKGADINQADKEGGVFPLLMAVQQGHTKIASTLIEKGADINQANSADGIFPLLMAAHQGHAEVVSVLIEKGADINQINNKDGVFPLLMAVQQGHTEVVSMLIEKGADINQADKEGGVFPLLIAAHQGHAEAVSVLIEKGADINQTNSEDGIFPLLMAAHQGHAEAVSALIEKGVNINKTNKENGAFALLVAAQQGHAEAVSMLIEEGADINQTNSEDGIFPLLMAAHQGHVKVVSMLIEEGADINQINNEDGVFPLLMAVQQGHAEVVSMLIEKGVDINQINNKNGAFPLLIAVQQGHAEVVSMLIQKGANINQINNKNGAFPLLIAAQQGHAEVVSMLIQKGTDINQINNKNSAFPLLIAAQQGHAEVVSMLIKKGADINQTNNEDGVFPLLIAAHQGHAEVVSALIQKEMDINQVDKESGAFPLLLAVQQGHAEVVSMLIEKGVDINQINNKNGAFPLLIAAQQGHAEVVSMLIEKGANINQTNKESGAFPLLLAVQQGHAEVVSMLIQKGADINQTNKESGVFPLLLAVQQGHAEVVSMLIQKGADINQTNKESGAFSLLLAAYCGHVKVVSLLLKNGADIDQKLSASQKTSLEIAQDAGRTGIVRILQEWQESHPS